MNESKNILGEEPKLFLYIIKYSNSFNVSGGHKSPTSLVHVDSPQEHEPEIQ